MSVADDLPLPEPLMLVEEVASLLRVSKMSIYRMVKGDQPALVGIWLSPHALRITRESVKALMGPAWPADVP